MTPDVTTPTVWWRAYRPVYPVDVGALRLFLVRSLVEAQLAPPPGIAAATVSSPAGIIRLSAN